MNVDAFLSSILVMIFLAWFYGPWQETCADYARQIVFENRDKLFDIASSGRISFTSKEYNDSREGMNAIIRFAHKMTVARTLYIYLCYKLKLISAHDDDYSTVTKNMKDADLRKEIEKIELASAGAVAKSMAARSLIIILTCLVVSPILIAFIYIYYLFAGFAAVISLCSGIFSGTVVRIIQMESLYGEDCL